LLLRSKSTPLLDRVLDPQSPLSDEARIDDYLSEKSGLDLSADTRARQTTARKIRTYVVGLEQDLLVGENLLVLADDFSQSGLLLLRLFPCGLAILLALILLGLTDGTAVVVVSPQLETGKQGLQELVRLFMSKYVQVSLSMLIRALALAHVPLE
jgi:hypothetical protein